MTTAVPKPSQVAIVVYQHAQETAFLWSQRSYLITEPHVSVRHLARHDDRLAAHIDGLRIAGEEGWKLCEAELSTEEPGAMFAAMVGAIEEKQTKRMDELFALAESVAAMQPGLLSAFGWVSSQFLQGTVKELLSSASPFRRCVGIASYSMHRVDPGQALDASMTTSDAVLRARALRAAGELGRRGLLPLCEQHLGDDDITCRFYAAWSSILLGNHKKAIGVLKLRLLAPGPFRDRAVQLALKVLPLNEGVEILKTLASDPSCRRLLINGAGIVGDASYVPWLIKQMETPEVARLAGESFTFISGVDLSYLHLEREPPENFESGPNDDPNDTNVAMDEDDSLPWPDQNKIQSWWNANQHRFKNGTRYFMGERLGVDHCKKVLREGFQRQRSAAALHLSLLQPGTPLFPTSAPAWQQQHWLSKTN
jgi:uncharacterized protein (TIGR02270 family)